MKYLKAGNGVGSDGGVGTAHVGRGINVIKRRCENNRLCLCLASIAVGHGGAENSSARR